MFEQFQLGATVRIRVVPTALLVLVLGASAMAMTGIIQDVLRIQPLKASLKKNKALWQTRGQQLEQIKEQLADSQSQNQELNKLLTMRVDVIENSCQPLKTSPNNSEDHPSVFDAQIKLVLTLWNNHQDTAAQRLLRNLKGVVKSSREWTAWLVCSGQIYLDLGHYTGAIEDLKRALKLNDKNPRAWLLLGQAQCAQLGPKAGIDAFAWAADLGAGAEALVHKARRCYRPLGRLNKAEATLRQALTMDPNHPRAWFELGQIKEARGHFEAAESCYSKAVRGQDPYFQASVKLALARLDYLTRPDHKALDLSDSVWLEHSSSLDNLEEVQAFMSYAWHTQQYQTLAKLCEKVRECNDAWMHRPHWFHGRNCGVFKAAVKDRWRRWVSNTSAWEAMAWREFRGPAWSTEYQKEALERDGKNSLASDFSPVSLSKLDDRLLDPMDPDFRDYKRCQELFQEAHEKSSTSLRENVQRRLKRLLFHNPKHRLAWLLKARIDWRAGQLQEARRACDQALNLRPDCQQTLQLALLIFSGVQSLDGLHLKVSFEPAEAKMERVEGIVHSHDESFSPALRALALACRAHAAMAAPSPRARAQRPAFMARAMADINESLAVSIDTEASANWAEQRAFARRLRMAMEQRTQRLLHRQEDRQALRELSETKLAQAERCFQIGQRLEQERKYLEAIEQYSHGLGFQPDHAASLFHRGRCRLKLGQSPESLIDMARALERDPQYDMRFFSGSCLHQAHAALKALDQCLTKLIKDAPEQSHLWFLRGLFALFRVDYEPLTTEQRSRALSDFDQAIKRNPKAKPLLLYRAHMKTLCGLQNSALEDLARVQVHFSKLAKLHFIRAWVWADKARQLTSHKKDWALKEMCEQLALAEVKDKDRYQAGALVHMHPFRFLKSEITVQEYRVKWGAR